MSSKTMVSKALQQQLKVILENQYNRSVTDDELSELASGLVALFDNLNRSVITQESGKIIVDTT